MKTLLKLVFLAALIAGGVAIYKRVVPPSFVLGSVRTVDAVTAMDGLGMQSGSYVFIGGDRLMLLRDNPNGSHVLIRADIGQKVIREGAQSGGVQDIRLNSGNVKLRRGGEENNPAFLLRKVGSPFEIHVGGNREITAEQWQDTLRRMKAGSKDPASLGMKVNYSFGERTTASVGWNEGTTGWITRTELNAPNSMADFNKVWTVDMLFPRPTKGSESYELLLFGNPVATLDAKLSVPAK